jgi:hypothetical protein
MTADVEVFVRHVRAEKLCLRGVRFWFAEKGLDWNDFVKNGIAASKLVETGDSVVAGPVARAEAEAAHVE